MTNTVKCFSIAVLLNGLFYSGVRAAEIDLNQLLTAKDRTAIEKLNGSPVIGTREDGTGIGGLRFRQQPFGRRPIGVTFEVKTGFLNIHFQRQLLESDTVQLRQITKLRTLFFTSQREPLTDHSLKYLAGVGMRGLVIWRSSVSNDGLKSLKHCPKLEQLNLSGSNFTDEGMSHLKELPHLKKLTLEKCGITNTGLTGR